MVSPWGRAEREPTDRLSSHLALFQSRKKNEKKKTWWLPPESTSLSCLMPVKYGDGAGLWGAGETMNRLSVHQTFFVIIDKSKVIPASETNKYPDYLSLRVSKWGFWEKVRFKQEIWQSCFFLTISPICFVVDDLQKKSMKGKKLSI